MAECFIYGQSGGNALGAEFDYTDVWHYYDVNSVDLKNLLWKDTIGTADFTLDDARIEDNSLVLPANKFGEATTQDEPKTLYFVVQKPICETNAVVFGLAGTTSSDGRTCSMYLATSYDWELSVSASPYLCYSYDTKCHVYTISRHKSVSGDNPSSMGNYGTCLYVDGKLIGFMDRGSWGNYAGFITLNRGYFGSYRLDRLCEQDSYFRAIAIGGEHSVEQILNNSKYLMNNYL